MRFDGIKPFACMKRKSNTMHGRKEYEVRRYGMEFAIKSSICSHPRLTPVFNLEIPDELLRPLFLSRTAYLPLLFRIPVSRLWKDSSDLQHTRVYIIFGIHPPSELHTPSKGRCCASRIQAAPTATPDNPLPHPVSPVKKRWK